MNFVDHDKVQNYFLRRVSGNRVWSRHRTRKFHPERFSKAISPGDRWRSYLRDRDRQSRKRKEKKKQTTYLLECSFLRTSSISACNILSLVVTHAIVTRWKGNKAARRLPLRSSRIPAETGVSSSNDRSTNDLTLSRWTVHSFLTCFSSRISSRIFADFYARNLYLWKCKLRK